MMADEQSKPEPEQAERAKRLHRGIEKLKNPPPPGEPPDRKKSLKEQIEERAAEQKKPDQ
jgi:hypothetical protein